MKKAHLALLLFIPFFTQAQYRFDGAVTPFEFLSGATVYSSGNWDEGTLFSNAINIGFNFNFMGHNVNQLYPTGYGVVALVDPQGNFDGTLNVFGAAMRAKDNNSPISYKTEGNPGNRIFKMEVKNAGFYYEYDSTNVVNYQLWLYEGGGLVEYHYGHGQYKGGAVIYQIQVGPSIGVSYSDGNQDYQLRLMYNPFWPDTTTDLTSEYYISGGPWDSLVYRFTPAGSVGLNDITTNAVQLHAFPNPANDQIFLTANSIIGQAEIVNCTGEVLENVKINDVQGTLDIADLPKGIYFIRIQTSAGYGIKKFVKQ